MRFLSIAIIGSLAVIPAAAERLGEIDFYALFEAHEGHLKQTSFSDGSLRKEPLLPGGVLVTPQPGQGYTVFETSDSGAVGCAFLINRDLARCG